MNREQLDTAIRSLGRMMRLLVLNMENNPMPGSMLASALKSQRDLIDSVLPHIPPDEMLKFDTRLNSEVERLIATQFIEDGIPDYPPWS